MATRKTTETTTKATKKQDVMVKVLGEALNRLASKESVTKYVTEVELQRKDFIDAGVTNLDNIDYQFNSHSEKEWWHK